VCVCVCVLLKSCLCSDICLIFKNPHDNWWLRRPIEHFRIKVKALFCHDYFRAVLNLCYTSFNKIQLYYIVIFFSDFSSFFHIYFFKYFWPTMVNYLFSTFFFLVLTTGNTKQLPGVDFFMKFYILLLIWKAQGYDETCQRIYNNKMLSLHNSHRAKKGLYPLKIDYSMTRDAFLVIDAKINNNKAFFKSNPYYWNIFGQKLSNFNVSCSGNIFFFLNQ